MSNISFLMLTMMNWLEVLSADVVNIDQWGAERCLMNDNRWNLMNVNDMMIMTTVGKCHYIYTILLYITLAYDWLRFDA